MKLQLRHLDHRPFGRVQMLTDEQGRALPGQRELTVSYSAGEMACVTVTFVVDGDDVTITDQPVTRTRSDAA